MSFSIIMDLIAITLLIATLIYIFVLYQQLKKNRNQLQVFVENFSLSLSRAEATIRELKELKETVLKSLTEQSHKADALKDELTFLLDHGETLSQQLENTIKKAKTMKKLDSSIENFFSVSTENLPEEPDLVRNLKKIR